MLQHILIALFIISIAVQYGFAFCFYIKLFTTKNIKAAHYNKIPVSVIICAKNEAVNLQKNLPRILQQRYNNEDGKPQYEVIVVNDSSTDDTLAILANIQKHYPHLKIINIHESDIRTYPGKKFALNIGIESAVYNLVVTTDADCQPASDTWLEKMALPLHHNKEIVAGYGPYHNTGTLLNSFIRWETIHTFLQYSTYTLLGVPYMAVGRNMAFSKQAFLTARNTAVWSKVPSGDDDFIVRAIGSGNNMAIVDDPGTFAFSEAKDSWDGWINQKKRHLSTGKYYKWPVKLLLGAYAFSHAVCWFTFIVLIFTGILKWVILVMAFRCLLYWLLIALAAGRLNEKMKGYFIPFFDLAWMIYNFAFSPYIIWKNKHTWK